jgi:predicted permease
MGTLLEDVRYAIRMLTKNPGFTLAAALTLALGIGANTAIFSMVDSFLLRPLPVKDPGQIAVLAFQQKHGPLTTTFSVPDYRDLRNQTQGVFSGLIGYQFGLDGLSVEGKPDRILTNYVTGNFFSLLGLKPQLGRLIMPTEGETPGADPVLVLSYSYWKSHFGGDPRVVGRRASVDGHPVTIIGVAPKGFFGVYSILDVQGYLPLGMAGIGGYPADFMSNRENRPLSIVGRLLPSANFKQADASLGVVAQRLSQEYPDSDKDMSIQAFPELRSRPTPDPDNTLMVVSGLFLGLAVLVLLVACVNVANILLVRATLREREMAIRAALGAARSRLVRQLLTESVLLALAGGAAGILFGNWCSSLLSSVNVQTDLPFRLELGFDWRVFTYAFAAALLTGIIVGLVPAIRASRGNLSTILHEGGRGVVGGRHRLRNALVVAQVGVTLMLLIIAGLFTRSLTNAQRTNLGFGPSHILNVSMDPNEIGYSEAHGREFYKNLLERVRSLPGVESASVASSVPMGYIGNSDALSVQGYQPSAGQPAPFANYYIISPDYFKTMGIPLLRGRSFTGADDEESPYVAIVNEAMAKSYWPNTDPIGRQFKTASDSKHAIQVIGVAKDSRYNNIKGAIDPNFYVPLAQHYASNSLETLQVRALGAPEAMIPEIEHVIESLAPDLPVFDVKTMTQSLNTLNGLLFYQIGAGLAAALGMLGLVLAIVGVYGVISYAANEKTHEIGIRLALGAQRLDILRIVFGQGLLIVGIGLAAGLVCAFAASRIMEKFLAVSPTDQATYLVVSIVLTLVALLACYIPARRAMRVDPMVALRYE